MTVQEVLNLQSRRSITHRHLVDFVVCVHILKTLSEVIVHQIIHRSLLSVVYILR